MSLVSAGGEYALELTNRMPSFSGKAIDSYNGSERTNSDNTKDTFDKVSSGPDKITLTIKKLKEGLEIKDENFEDHLTKEFSLSDIQNSQDQERYARFYITTPYPLVDGYYQVNLSLKDQVGNTYNHSAFYLSLNPNQPKNKKNSLVGVNLETKITEQQTTPIATEEEKEKVKREGYSVKIKVVDNQNNPVKGARVTLHSRIQEAITGKDGTALFTDVEKGEHKILIAYNGYEGEQKVNLAGDEIKEFSFNIQIKQRSAFTDIKVILAISALAITIAVLGILLVKARRNKTYG